LFFQLKEFARSLFRENDLCCINELRDPDLKETILGKKKKKRKKKIGVYVYVHAITLVHPKTVCQ